MISLPDARYFDRSTPAHITTLVALAGVSALAMNVFLPSLSRMATHFETSYGVMQLSVSVYLAVNALIQIFTGPVSDNLGRRPVILWGLVLFVFATIGCIFAPNATIFLIFRMMQGVIVTSMVLSRAIVRDLVPGPESASIIGYVTMGMAVVPMVGPMIGGFLDELFGWQANFWLLAIVGSLLFWICYRDLGETKSVSGISLIDQFKQYPELLSSPRFWGYALASGMTSGAFFAYLGGAPKVGSDIFNLDPSTLGLYFGTPAAGYFLGNYISGRYSVRFGINAMVLSGAMIATAGTGLSLAAFYAGKGDPNSFFGFMTIVGLGNGMTIPNATSGMLSVRPHLAGTASGLGGAIMIALGAALSAVAGAILETSALPLLWLMFFVTMLGVAFAIAVILRTRAMGE